MDDGETSEDYVEVTRPSSPNSSKSHMVKSTTGVSKQSKDNSHLDGFRENHFREEGMGSVNIKELDMKDVGGKADGEAPKKRVNEAVDRNGGQGRAEDFENRKEIGNMEQEGDDIEARQDEKANDGGTIFGSLGRYSDRVAVGGCGRRELEECRTDQVPWVEGSRW